MSAVCKPQFKLKTVKAEIASKIQRVSTKVRYTQNAINRAKIAAMFAYMELAHYSYQEKDSSEA